MNVIQQEALAKSVGMTREDLAKSLIEREALAAAGLKEGTAIDAYNKLKREGLSDDQIAKKLGDDKLAAQLKSQSVQERFNASVEKLREIFISVAEPILQIVSPFMDLATTILPLINIALIPITGAFKFIGESVQFFIGGIKLALSYVSELGSYFTPMFEGLKEFVSNFEGLIPVLNVVSGALKFIVGLLTTSYLIEQGRLLVAKLTTKEKEKGIVSTIKDNLLGKKGLLPLIGKAAMTAFKSLAAIPIVGPALGIAAAASAAALGYKFMQGDDVVSQGYGKRTLMAPEGAIALNDKDTVIAGTNLGGKNQSANAPSSPSINLSPLVERMAAVENLLGQILSKEGTVYLDGNKVGTAMAMGTYKTQ